MTKQLVVSIDNRWRLVAEKTGWQVQQKRRLVKGPRRGQVDWADEGHFDTLKWACLFVFKQMLHAGKGDATLKQLAQRIEQAERTLCQAVESLRDTKEEPILSDSPWDLDEAAA